MDGLNRRDFIKLSGMAAGSLAVGSFLSGCDSDSTKTSTSDQGDLEIFPLGEPLASDEMRITFLGTSFLPRLAQECNSVFVETGNGDSFVFDLGSGVSAKYNAMGIPPSRMEKVFLTHLHGDHTSDLITLYCFGPSQDRKTPLNIWGPTRSGLPDPVTGIDVDDGTKAFCNRLKELMYWHVQGFSFLPTGYGPGNDGYDIDVTELPWATVGGTAYEKNGVKITHFPAAHDRNGSISYRLDWNGLSMVFSGDTKPNDYMISQAKGVDVLVHEMVVPVDVWAAKNSGLQPGDPGWDQAVQAAQAVQDSSHTPQKALGYILSQTNPRLGVATHFQVNEDTVGPALDDIRSWYQGPVAIATDLLVINVSSSQIRQRRAVVDDFAWYAKPTLSSGLAPALYPTPTAQLDQTVLLDHCIQEAVYDNPPQ